MMGRFLIMITAFVAILGGGTFAGVHIISAVERPPTTTTTYSMKVGSLTRQYEVIAPTATLAKSAPIIVMLGGASATTSVEIARDGFLPDATADKAELVYPVAIKESWNAIGCCDAAAAENINDVGFIEALAFGWALLGAGLLWSDRGAPHKKFAAAGSASSFGIYLAHPLVLQGLLLLTGASFLGPDGGWLGAIRRAPDGLTVLVLLFVAVPIIYAAAWLIASAARRTPASLMLTGREYAAEKKKGSG